MKHYHILDIINNEIEDTRCCAQLDEVEWSDSELLIALLTQNVVSRPALQIYLFGRLMLVLPYEHMKNFVQHLGDIYQPALHALPTSIFGSHYREKVMRLCDVVLEETPIDFTTFSNIASLTRYTQHLPEKEWCVLRDTWRNDIHAFKKILSHYSINSSCYGSDLWNQLLFLLANTNLSEAMTLVLEYPFLFDSSHPTVSVIHSLAHNQACDISQLWADGYDGRSEYDVLMWYFYNKTCVDNNDAVRESIHQYINDTYPMEQELPSVCYQLNNKNKSVTISRTLLERCKFLYRKNKIPYSNIVSYAQYIIQPNPETLQTMTLLFQDGTDHTNIMTYSDFLKITFMANASIATSSAKTFQEEHILL